MDYMDDSEPMAEESSAQGEIERESDSGKTALINADICPGMKPGDSVTLTIDKVLDSGEYQVSYAPEEKEEPMQEAPAAPPEDSEMSAYMS